MCSEDGKALPGVSITVKEKKASDVLSYALSDDNGSYLLMLKSVSDSVVITVSGLNLKKQILTVPNKSQSLSFTLVREAIQLKEIKVKPIRIRQVSDTLSYHVDSFADSNDRTIGDVLKKLPGITVKEDGSINYNNKPINKFYIEGADLLQGRYGIATNNIEAKVVAAVEVLENHQPVKALKEREFTDEAAINLKLKDSAKGVLVATGQLGTGLSPILWNNELFSMLFNKERQNINTYKGNNTGYNAGAELNILYPGDGNMDKNSMLFTQSPSPPPISQKRFLFNQSHAFSSNNLWSLGKNYQLNATLGYLNDRQERSSYSRSVYYVGEDSLLSVEESMAALEHINSFSASIQLNANEENLYLDNVLGLKGEWNADRGNVANLANTDQELDKSFHSIANTFSLVKNQKKYNIKIHSFNGYSRSPQTLTIQPWLYGDLFETPGGRDMARQSLRQKYFSSSSRITLGVDKGAFKQSYEAGVNINLKQLDAVLTGRTVSGGFADPPDSLVNQLTWNKYQVLFQPGYTYTANRLKATLSLPVSFNHLYEANKVNKSESKKNTRLFFNPAIKLRYDLSLLLNLSFSAAFNSDFGEIENGLTGYLMRSYRSIVKNAGELPEYRNQSYSMDVVYRQALREFFFNGGTSYSRGKSNLLYGYDYRGELSLKKSYSIPNWNDTYLVYGRVSKGIEPLSSTVTLETDYRSTKATQINQSITMNYSNRSYRVKPGITSKLGKWASLSYSLQFMQSKNRVQNNDFVFGSIRSIVQRGQLNLFSVERLTVNLGYENFYNSSVISGKRSINFADAGIKYRYRKLEFDLEYLSIFNVGQFISAIYNETNTFYSEYTLRPSQLLLKVRFKIK
jgi:hypothetical protein